MKTKLLTLKELQAKKPAEISKYIAELQRNRLSLLEQVNSGKTKQTHLLKAMKRSVAQAKTVVANEQIKKEEKK